MLNFHKAIKTDVDNDEVAELSLRKEFIKTLYNKP
jgi:hypothetical protein